jgi:hypothetical protein
MNFIANRIPKLFNLLNKNIYNYGQISFTQQINRQSEFTRVPAYRAYDLQGQLLDKSLQIDL